MLVREQKGSKQNKEHCKRNYEPYSDEQISRKISLILKEKDINAEVEVVYQSIENLHLACPENLGDWYFSGEYPTPVQQGG